MTSKTYVKTGLALIIVIVFMAIFSPIALGCDYLWTPGGSTPSDPNNTPNEKGDDRDLTGGDPVYLNNGEHTFSCRDMSILGRSLDVVIGRRYRSKSEYNSRYGYGWDINYNLKIRRLHDPNTIILLDGRNRKQEYTVDVGDPNIYLHPTDTDNYLYYNGDDTFTLVKKYGTELDFDINGNLSTITDRNGNTITFTYDSNGLLPLFGPSEFFMEYNSSDPNLGGPSDGRGLIAMSYKLVKITDDLGRDIDFTYNSNGLLHDVTDFANRTWTYSYDNNTNDLLTVTGPNTVDYPDGLTTTYAYDDNHNLISITDPNGQTWLVNTYDSNDMVEWQTYGDANFTFGYDSGSNETTVTNRRDVNNVAIYDDAGNAISETIYTNNLRQGDPASYTTSYEYNSERQMTKKILPAGNFIDYTYDANGNVLSISREPNNSEPNIVTCYTYESNFNFVKTMTDPRGNVTTFDYNDLNGNLEKITYPEVNTPNGPNSPVVSFTYNTFGQVETVTAPDEIVTKFEYYDDSDPNDPNCGRLWKVIVDYNDIDGLNITTTYKYDILGNIAEVNDPNGDITGFAYNELNQLIQTIDPLNNTTNLWYNKNKKLSWMERERTNDPNQITSFTYNILDKLKTVTDPLNYVTKVDYDNSDNLSDVNDAEENNTHYDYDERDLLWKVTDANGGVTEYSYTLNGKLTQIKDPNGDITKYDYDGFDRLVRINYPDDSNEEFGYDKNSNVTSYKNRNDETIYYEYDALNRLIVKNRPGDPNITYLYDVAGRVADVNDGRSVANGGGLTTYTYDRIGRVTEVNDIENRIVKYEYDSRSLRTKLTYPGNMTLRYEYDSIGRLTKARSGPWILAQYKYDELGRRMLVTLKNDANAVYEYDLGNRLKKLSNNINDGNSIVFDYADYDKVGNRKSCKIDNLEAHVYNYDVLYQFTFVDYNDGNSTDYYYDSLGNRTSVVNGGTTNYSSNQLNQYTAVGGTNYSYENNGNLAYDGTKLYSYDCENRMISSRFPLYSYKYDFAGRRISKTVSGTTTKYAYDGDQVIAEYDGDGVLLRKFVYGPGIDEPIMMIDVADNNKIYYYHFDGLGSVVALSDSSSNVVERYSYDVFGEPNRVSDVNNPYLFTGRRYDNETGLYYYRARYYSPKIGRFLQTDPIGYYDSMNLYEYCWNNPVNWIDPWGLRTRNKAGGWDYTYKETQRILREGHETMPYNPLRHMKRPNKGGWDYGASPETQNDRFTVPKQNGEKGSDLLDASEFGNYMTGYMSTYHGGVFGYYPARFLGNYLERARKGERYSILKSFYGGDDPLSVRDLKRGSRDGRRRSREDAISTIRAIW